MLIRELITRLGFDVDYTPLNQFDAKIQDTKEDLGKMESAADEAMDSIKGLLSGLKNTLIGLSVGTVAASAGLIAMVKSAANVGDEINKTAPLLGFSIEGFQKYRYAAKLAGVENENFAGSIQLLLRNIAEAKQGNKEIAKSFGRAGIDPNSLKGMGTEDILRRLSTGLSKIPDQATRVSVSMDLLGRSGARMGMFLAQGTEAMDAIMGDVETFGMFSKESAQQAEDFNDSLDRVLFFFSAIKNEIGQAFLPVFTKILNEFRVWITQHREIIKIGLAKGIAFLTDVITKAWEQTKRIVHAFETMIRLAGGYRNSIRLLGIALMGLFAPFIGPLFLAVKGIGFLLLPFIRLHTLITLVTIALSSLMPIWTLFIGVVSALAANQIIGWLIRLAGGYRALATAILIPTLAFLAQAAAVAALILIFEDLYIWIAGGKSVIGEWLGAWVEVPNKLRKVWEDIKSVFKEGGAFIMAVLRGDWKEAARLFGEMSAPVVKVGSAAGKAIANGLAQTSGMAKSGAIPLKDVAGAWSGMAPAYAFASGTRGPGGFRNDPRFAPGPGSFVRSISLDSAIAAMNAEERGGAGGGRAVVHQSIQKAEVNVNLPQGTPQEHAEETARIFNDLLGQHIDHSLQQSVPPGG